LTIVALLKYSFIMSLLLEFIDEPKKP
jgi:hypothetical protein